MTDFKRRSANAIPLKKGSAPDPALRHVKLEAKALQEQLQKSVIDNPQAAKKAAMLISLWIEGKTRTKKKVA